MMTIKEAAILFGRWLTLNTTDVDTMGVCKRYKNKIKTIDELYDIWWDTL